MTEGKSVIYRANGEIITILVYTPEELGHARFDSIEQKLKDYNENPYNIDNGFTAEIVADPKTQDIILYFKERPQINKDDLLEALEEITDRVDFLKNEIEGIKEK